MKKKELKAILDNELEELLKNLELYDDFVNHKLKCFYCDKLINEDNFFSVFVHDHKIKICCNEFDCSSKFYMNNIKCDD